MLKSTSYILRNPKLQDPCSESGSYLDGASFRYVFDAPGLSAYEIHGLYVPPIGNMDGMMIQPSLEALGDKVLIALDGSFGPLIMAGHVNFACEVKYYGVKNYRNYFGNLENPEQAARGAFYLEEAERSFDASAYFSFLLMAGAVLESLLQARLPKGKKSTLNPLIDAAAARGILPEVAPYFRTREQIIEEWQRIADARNMLHPNRLDTTSIRERAMDCRSILDKTLKSVWTNPSMPKQ